MRDIKETRAQAIYYLIGKLENIKNAYFAASEKMKDEVLALLLERFGYQRGRYSNELKQVVTHLGTGSSIDHETFGLLHRTWKELKTSFRFTKKEDLIQACIRNDENALRNYNMVLTQIPDNDEVKMILQQQVNGIKTVLNTIKEYTGRTNS
ncbi:MAG TPA: PA2169 family four-helix-bundle protein [Ferruginibacter sp.]|nr:PA2169 family four-helix-bundle protein [Ferruginibacter sp.]